MNGITLWQINGTEGNPALRKQMNEYYICEYVSASESVCLFIFITTNISK